MQPQIPAPLNVDPEKVADDFSYLLTAFEEVLHELGHGDVARALPWGNHDPIESIAGETGFIEERVRFICGCIRSIIR